MVSAILCHSYFEKASGVIRKHSVDENKSVLRESAQSVILAEGLIINAKEKK